MKKLKIALVLSILTLCTACPPEDNQEQFRKSERRTGFYF